MAKILVIGSLAFDVIFEIHGNVKNEIPLDNGQIKNINLMFIAKEKQEYFGGTAGNIAYGLGLLQEHPQLFSIAGKDFAVDYGEHLTKVGVELKTIIKEDEYSATFYGISDEAKQQIGIWQPNAYDKWVDKASLSDTLTQREIKDIKLAIFAPGTGGSTSKLLREFRKINKQASVIFDPGQQLSISYDRKKLLSCLALSDILIGNTTEFAQLQTLFDLDVPSLLALGIKAAIETQGELGANIYENSLTTHIDSFKPDNVFETTGAGDAFRAGLIFGLIHGKSLGESCKIAAYMGAKSVGEMGGQMYNINLQDITKI